MVFAGALIAASLAIPATNLFAGATTATIFVSGGALEFIDNTPTPISFSPVILNGLDSQGTSGHLTFDISDATGSAAGWKIEASSSVFSNGSGPSLPSGATTIAAPPVGSCDSDSSCVVARTNVAYPYTLPAGSQPTTSLFNAVTGTGIGNETVSPVFTVDLPGSAVAAAYSATWTFSLISGP